MKSPTGHWTSLLKNSSSSLCKDQQHWTAPKHRSRILENKTSSRKAWCWTGVKRRFQTDSELAEKIHPDNSGLLCRCSSQTSSFRCGDSNNLLDTTNSCFGGTCRCTNQASRKKKHLIQPASMIQEEFRAVWGSKLLQNSSIHSNTFLWDSSFQFLRSNSQACSRCNQTKTRRLCCC